MARGAGWLVGAGAARGRRGRKFEFKGAAMKKRGKIGSGGKSSLADGGGVAGGANAGGVNVGGGASAGVAGGANSNLARAASANAGANASANAGANAPAKEPVERFCVSLSPQLLAAFDEFLAFKEQGRSECVRELIRHALLAQSWGANSHDFCAVQPHENGENLGENLGENPAENPAQNRVKNSAQLAPNSNLNANGGENPAAIVAKNQAKTAENHAQNRAQLAPNSNLDENGENGENHAHENHAHSHGGENHAHGLGWHTHGDENHFHNHGENHTHDHTHEINAHAHAHSHAHGGQIHSHEINDHAHSHSHENPAAPREFVAVFACVFDHHQHDLLAKKTAIEHAAHIQIVCTTHIHIDCHNCLETSVLKSLDAREIEGFCRKIGALKGVKFSNLARVAVWDF